MYDFTFDIADVAIILGLHIRHKSSIALDVDCPFCGEHKGKLNLSLRKNAFRCNRCGESGGMIALYAKVFGLDIKSAYGQIKDKLGSDESVPEYQVKKKSIEPAEVIVNAAQVNDKTKHEAYTKLLSFLQLTETHESRLLERGFTKNQIAVNGYKSTPAFGFRKIVQRMLDVGCDVKGVPGFYEEADGTWNVCFYPKSSGILIPVRTIDGHIVGMQIRLDRPLDGRKYIWLSSARKNMGVSSGSPIHFVGDIHSEIVYMTEGPLKGDLAYALSGKTFGCVPGANQYANLYDFFMSLKKNGVKQVIECYDMDKLTNKNVEHGVSHFFEIAKECDLPARQLVWDAQYKGIDDYLGSLRSFD